MPTKFRHLKQEAALACKYRGHSMRPFSETKSFFRDGRENHLRKSAIATCKYCHMAVRVVMCPMPNEIDIGGEAVALNCTEVSKR